MSESFVIWNSNVTSQPLLWRLEPPEDPGLRLSRAQENLRKPCVPEKHRLFVGPRGPSRDSQTETRPTERPRRGAREYVGTRLRLPRRARVSGKPRRAND